MCGGTEYCILHFILGRNNVKICLLSSYLTISNFINTLFFIEHSDSSKEEMYLKQVAIVNVVSMGKSI